MKFTLFYREIPLGVLEKIERGYAYTSYIENEQDAFNRRILTNSEYSLCGSFKRESRKLFPEFEEILRRCSRKDILESSAINPKDSDWEKIIKLSQLKFFQQNFYVQRTGDMEEESKYYLHLTLCPHT